MSDAAAWARERSAEALERARRECVAWTTPELRRAVSHAREELTVEQAQAVRLELEARGELAT